MSAGHTQSSMALVQAQHLACMGQTLYAKWPLLLIAADFLNGYTQGIKVMYEATAEDTKLGNPCRL